MEMEGTPRMVGVRQISRHPKTNMVLENTPEGYPEIDTTAQRSGIRALPLAPSGLGPGECALAVLLDFHLHAEVLRPRRTLFGSINIYLYINIYIYIYIYRSCVVFGPSILCLGCVCVRVAGSEGDQPPSNFGGLDGGLVVKEGFDTNPPQKPGVQIICRASHTCSKIVFVRDNRVRVRVCFAEAGEIGHRKKT